MPDLPEGEWKFGGDGDGPTVTLQADGRQIVWTLMPFVLPDPDADAKRALEDAFNAFEGDMGACLAKLRASGFDLVESGKGRQHD